jgi:hypothetical protein
MRYCSYNVHGAVFLPQNNGELVKTGFVVPPVRGRTGGARPPKQVLNDQLTSPQVHHCVISMLGQSDVPDS